MYVNGSIIEVIEKFSLSSGSFSKRNIYQDCNLIQNIQNPDLHKNI